VTNAARRCRYSSGAEVFTAGACLPYDEFGGVLVGVDELQAAPDLGVDAWGKFWSFWPLWFLVAMVALGERKRKV
jgi:hypothetical protein